MQQIADMCNVSRGTVDRVLHNRPNVHPKIRQAVLNAAERMGYQAPAKSAESKRIGILLPGFPDKYFLGHAQHGVRDAQEKIDKTRCQIITEQMGGRAPEEHVQAIKRLLTYRPHGLVINIPQSAEVTALVNQCIAQGIAVLTYFDEAPDCQDAYFVGQDVVRSGKIAAGLMAKYVTAGERVLCISGEHSLHSHRGRAENFAQYLTALTGMPELVDIQYCHEFLESTAQAVRTALEHDTRIHYIYMATQSVAGCILGIAQARPHNRISVICNDTTADARKYLLSGDIDFVIGQRASYTVYQAIWSMYQLVCFGVVPREKQQYTDLMIYTRQMLHNKEEKR